jgi:hypothetical protein
MAQWLIVLIVRLIIFKNRKWFWISYSNSNTFHVESFVRFKKYAKYIQIQTEKSYSNTFQKIGAKNHL